MTFTTSAQEKKLDRSKPPLAGPPKDVKFPAYFDTTLENGINLLVIENSKIPAVTVRIVFKDCGSVNDFGKPGLASATSELLTKGTATRTAEEISESVEYFGASLSSGSDHDVAYITLSVLKKHFFKAFEILSDVIQNPVFPENELNLFKQQRIASIIQAKDNPDVLSEKMFAKIVFAGHPYSQPAEGTEEAVKSLTREEVIDFYNRYYLPSNMIVAFVGDINKHEALEIFSDHFKNFNNRLEDTVQNIIPDAHYISRHSVHIIDRPGAVQSNIKIGHIGVKRNNPDYIKVTVMNTLLGGYFGSRINYLLREIHGFTYGARSDFEPRLYSGEFSVNTDVRTEVTDTAVNLIINELKKITTGKVNPEELQKVKNYLSGVFPLQLETANAVASRVIGLKLYNLPSDYYNKYISEIIKITEDDILYTAVKYIKPEQLTIVVTGNAALLKDKLSVFGEVIIYDTDLNEKVLN